MAVRKNFEDELGIAEDVNQAEIILEKQTLPIDIIEKISTIDAGIIQDYNSSREGLKIAIEVAKKGIAVMLNDFTLDPAPRSAEALSRLIDSMTSSSKALIDNIKTISELYVKIQNNNPDNENVKNVFNNAIIIGTLEEAMALKEEDGTEDR